jgi:Domain of unknown function (DUF3291)
MPIAQLNIAKMLAPIESELMSDFVAQLAEVNALAESSDGFIWRLVGDGIDDATGLRPFPDDLMYIVNMSVWKDGDSLFRFVYENPRHREVMMQRKKWFEKMEKMHLVLWHIEEGQQPTLDDAKLRIEHYWEHGESDFAFSFKYLKKNA